MANRTKAELINEIEHLRTENYERSERLREKSKEIKLLRDQATCDAFEVRELRNEIRDLQDVVIALRNDCNNLTAEKHEKANKVKELEQVLKTAVDMRDFWLEEKDSEISKLDKAVAQLGGVIGEKDKKIKDLQADAVHDAKESDNKSNDIERLRVLLRGADARISENDKQIKRLQGDKTWLQQLEAEYRKEIRQLRADAVHDAEELDKKSNKISKLQKAYNEINGAFWGSLKSQRKKDNEIKDLRHDYDNRQAIITEMSKEINELKAKVDRLEKVNDSRRFHNATEALGNPEHFQEVS